MKLTGRLVALRIRSAPPRFEPDFTPQAMARVTAVQGCWILREVGRQRWQVILPLRLGFDTSLNTRGLRRLVVDTTQFIRARVTGWAPDAKTAAYGGYVSTGYAGIRFRLTLRDDTLRGRAYPFSDVKSWQSSLWPSSFGIRATRTACDGLLPN